MSSTAQCCDPESSLARVLCLGGPMFRNFDPLALVENGPYETIVHYISNQNVQNLVPLVSNMVDNYEPDILVLSIGSLCFSEMLLVSNVYSCIEHVDRLLNHIQFKFPSLKIVVAGMMPWTLGSLVRCRNFDHNDLEDLNRDIIFFNECAQDICVPLNNVSFLDVSHLISSIDGQPKKRYFVKDGLHLNRRGMITFGRAIVEHLNVMCKTKMNNSPKSIPFNLENWPELPSQNVTVKHGQESLELGSCQVESIPMPLCPKSDNACLNDPINTNQMKACQGKFLVNHKIKQSQCHIPCDICEGSSLFQRQGKSDIVFCDIFDLKLDENKMIPVNVGGEKAKESSRTKQNLQRSPMHQSHQVYRLHKNVNVPNDFKICDKSNNCGKKNPSTSLVTCNSKLSNDKSIQTKMHKTKSCAEKKKQCMERNSFKSLMGKYCWKTLCQKNTAPHSLIDFEHFNPYCVLDVEQSMSHEQDENCDNFNESNESEKNISLAKKKSKSSPKTNNYQHVQREHPVSECKMKNLSEKTDDKKQLGVNGEPYTFTVNIGNNQTYLAVSPQENLNIHELVHVLNKQFFTEGKPRMLLCNGQLIKNEESLIHHTDKLELLHKACGGVKEQGRDIHPERNFCGPCKICKRKDGRFFHLQSRIGSDNNFVTRVLEEHGNISLRDCICRKCEGKLKRKFTTPGSPQMPVIDEKVAKMESSGTCFLSQFNMCRSTDIYLHKCKQNLETVLDTFGLGGAHNIDCNVDIKLCSHHSTQIFNKLKQIDSKCAFCEKHVCETRPLPALGTSSISNYTINSIITTFKVHCILH
jgi:hypothetical protein